MGVGTLASQEFFVGSRFNYPSSFENDNPVRLPNRGKAMRNQQRSAVLHQPTQRLENRVLRLRIERAGRLIENQNRRVFQ